MFRLATLLLLASLETMSISVSAAEKIVLGQDVDYPPYAYKTEDGELAGFGKDIADGMTALCPNLEIEVVEKRWSNCWSSDNGGTLGSSIENGVIDGCMTYTHTQGIRNELCEFSDGILKVNKAAGLLTLLDENGEPMIAGDSDLSGKTIIDVGGWAPTADGLQYVTNKCTDTQYAQDYELITANGEQANDVAMRMLRNGTGEAIFIYSDQGYRYSDCRDGATWDCTLWEGFGVDYAYVQSGQFGYVVNGTTLALSKKGSGIRDKLRPCMTQYMATEEYYKVCQKHDLVSSCYPNEFFPSNGATTEHAYDIPADEQDSGCSNGYCPCDMSSSDEESSEPPIVESSSVGVSYMTCVVAIAAGVSITMLSVLAV